MAKLTIIPDLDAGTAIIKGNCFGGEHVSVTLSSCSSLLTDTLRFRLMFAGVVLAIFPLEEGDAFAINNKDLSFTLNLNTYPLLRALKSEGSGELWCDVVLDDIGPARTPYIISQMNIGEWRLVAGDGTPLNLDDYRNARQLDGKIDALANALKGQTISSAPTARETAEAAKKLVLALGGEVS